MGGEQKIFIATLAERWKRDMPFLEQVDINEIPKAPRGCNYRLKVSMNDRFYFVRIEFNRKKRGEFSIGITASLTPIRSTLDASGDRIPCRTSIGSFGIWQFPNVPFRAWSLVDLELENVCFLGLGTGLPPSPQVWRPTTYSQPIDRIIEEAITNVTKILKNNVFPTLEIPL